MKNGLIILLLLLNCISYGQDIHFSQYNASPGNLNPALTGLFDGDYRFILNHRNQWSSVTIPYKTYSAAGDARLKMKMFKNDLFGAGLVLNNDKAGDSEFGTTQGNLALAYIKRLNGDSTHFISLGLQGGLTQRSFNIANLKFDSQYNGDFFDPSLASGEVFDRTSFTYFDLGTGINWLYSPVKKLLLTAGISLHHINRPSQTFYGNDEVKLHRKFVFHASSVIHTSKNFDIIPSAISSLQGTYREYIIGGSVRYAHLTKTFDHNAFYFGTHYRFADAIIIAGGAEYNNLNIGLSYDINISGLRPASNGRGGFELSLIYIIRRFTPIKPERKICPPYL